MVKVDGLNPAGGVSIIQAVEIGTWFRLGAGEGSLARRDSDNISF